MTLPFPPAEEIARLTARMLLEIKAVHFNAAEPYTYASGLKGPTYIDCRKLISFPRIRSTLMDFLSATVLRDAGFVRTEVRDDLAGIGRVVVERMQNSRSDSNTRLLFQLEFVGFSRLSLGADPLRSLQENVPGYRPLRDRSGPVPSRFSNYD